MEVLVLVDSVVHINQVLEIMVEVVRMLVVSHRNHLTAEVEIMAEMVYLEAPEVPEEMEVKEDMVLMDQVVQTVPMYQMTEVMEDLVESVPGSDLVL